MADKNETEAPDAAEAANNVMTSLVASAYGQTIGAETWEACVAAFSALPEEEQARWTACMGASWSATMRSVLLAKIDTTRPLSDQLAEAQRLRKLLDRRISSIFQASIDAPNERKICADSVAKEEIADRAESSTFPVTINGATVAARTPAYTPREKTAWADTSKWVSVRLAGDDPKTYLGVLIGEIALNLIMGIDPKTQILHVDRTMSNPAIYVFDLDRIVFGAESWWGPIDKPEDLVDISDKTILEIPYVKAAMAAGIGIPNLPTTKDTIAAAKAQAAAEQAAAEVNAPPGAVPGGGKPPASA